MFLNKSFAMSANAPVRVRLIYDEFEMRGYPPTVDFTTPVRTGIPENIGFGDLNPSAFMTVDPANTGRGTAAEPLQVVSTAGFADGDVINYGGQTVRIADVVSGTELELDPPLGIWNVDTGAYDVPTQGTLYRVDYENYLVVGDGRTGGSFDNDFTTELKRIIDNPEYADLLRYGLMKNVFITASVNTPFSDMVSSKIMLDWDRRKRRVEIEQVAFTAFFKSA
jgi:hypothetical protein